MTTGPAPYYRDELVTLYLGDCLEVTEWLAADVLVTDPPYPSNVNGYADTEGPNSIRRYGWFKADVEAARQVLQSWTRDALVFWSELEPPPVPVPLVAVHIWYRTNVNGKPYEPVYHFAVDGRKRRSEVVKHCQIHSGVGPGAGEYVGHPTQKPMALMRYLVGKAVGDMVADPFAGSGSTLAAAKSSGRRAIGVESDERYCEIAAKRLAQDAFDFGGVA